MTALGLGQLALGEPTRAREHLEKALAAGYTSANLEYALGQALGELYRRALEETRRITQRQERQRKVALLDTSLRQPTLLHLRAAMGTRLEVPEYVEGLIALYEGRHDEAIAKAKAAFDKAPWMYEPKKLEGDALYAEGSKYRHAGPWAVCWMQRRPGWRRRSPGSERRSRRSPRRWSTWRSQALPRGCSRCGSATTRRCVVSCPWARVRIRRPAG